MSKFIKHFLILILPVFVVINVKSLALIEKELDKSSSIIVEYHKRHAKKEWEIKVTEYGWTFALIYISNILVNLEKKIGKEHIGILNDKEIELAWDAANKKNRSLECLIRIFQQIDSADIEILRKPILLTILKKTINTSLKNKKHDTEFLKKLPKNVLNELKYLCLDHYVLHLSDYLIREDKNISALNNASEILLTDNRKHIITNNFAKICVIDALAEQVLHEIKTEQYESEHINVNQAVIFDYIRCNDNYVVAVVNCRDEDLDEIAVWDIKTGNIVKVLHYPIKLQRNYIKYVDNKFFAVEYDKKVYFYKFDQLNPSSSCHIKLDIAEYYIVIDDRRILCKRDDEYTIENLDAPSISFECISNQEGLCFYDNFKKLIGKVDSTKFLLKYLAMKKIIGAESICMCKASNFPHMHFQENGTDIAVIDLNQIMEISLVEKLIANVGSTQREFLFNKNFMMKLLKYIYYTDFTDLIQKIHEPKTYAEVWQEIKEYL